MKGYTVAELVDKAPFVISISSMVNHLDKYKCKYIREQRGKGFKTKVYLLESLADLWEFIRVRNATRTYGISSKQTVFRDYKIFADKKGIVFNIPELLWNGRKVKVRQQRLVFVDTDIDVMKDWYDNFGFKHEYKNGAVGRVVL